MTGRLRGNNRATLSYLRRFDMKRDGELLCTLLTLL